MLEGRVRRRREKVVMQHRMFKLGPGQLSVPTSVHSCPPVPSRACGRVAAGGSRQVRAPRNRRGRTVFSKEASMSTDSFILVIPNLPVGPPHPAHHHVSGFAQPPALGPMQDPVMPN